MKKFLILSLVYLMAASVSAIPPRMVGLTEPQRETQNQSLANYAPQAKQTAMPLNIAPRGLVILTSFKDLAFTTPRDTLDSMFNGQNFTRDYSFTFDDTFYDIHSEGSARKYFEDCSFGQYSPVFDLVGPFTISKNMEEYDDSGAQLMIKESVTLAHENGVDFSRYDNDNDGKVDFVYVVYAGYSEADGGPKKSIWPHASNVTKYDVEFDGKRIYKYACCSELNFWSKRFYGVGTFCHEFGHVLGLKDLYDTYRGTKTQGEWDVMDIGCYNNDANTPPTYSAYERFFLGWITPTLLTEYGEVTLPNLGTSNQTAMISATGRHNMIGNDPDPTIFYLLENRQQIGWDKDIPGHGMLLTRVDYDYDYWKNNAINTKPYRVDMIEADGDDSGIGDDWYGKPGDSFPCGASSYSGIEGCSIMDIQETDGVIRFALTESTPTFSVQAELTDAPRKIFRNGEIVILRNGHVYSILGTQVK